MGGQKESVLKSHDVLKRHLTNLVHNFGARKMALGVAELGNVQFYSACNPSN